MITMLLLLALYDLPRTAPTGWYFTWYEHSGAPHYSGPYYGLNECRHGLRGVSRREDFKSAVLCYYHEQRGA